MASVITKTTLLLCLLLVTSANKGDGLRFLQDQTKPRFRPDDAKFLDEISKESEIVELIPNNRNLIDNNTPSSNDQLYKTVPKFRPDDSKFLDEIAKESELIVLESIENNRVLRGDDYENWTDAQLYESVNARADAFNPNSKRYNPTSAYNVGGKSASNSHAKASQIWKEIRDRN